MPVQIKITLKPTDKNVGDETYKIVQIDNAIRVHAGSKEFHVNDFLTESEAEQLVRDRKQRVTVKS